VRASLATAKTTMNDLDIARLPTPQPGLFPTLAKFSADEIMFRFAVLQNLNRITLLLHNKLDVALSRYRWSLLAQLRREKSAVFLETKMHLLRMDFGPQPNEGPKIRVSRRAGPSTVDSSVFLQVFKQLHAVAPQLLGHSQRAFQVEFLGEGASDAGGPYREVLTNICSELQSGALALLLPTPNARESVGTNTDQWMPNPSQTSALALQHYTFLGRLMGIAARTGTPLSLDLSPMLWKQLAGEQLVLADLALADARSAELLKRIGRGELVEEDELEMFFVTRLSDGTEVELRPGGAKQRVTRDNAAEYVALAQQVRLHECSAQVAAIQAGLSQLVSVELLSLFTWREVEELICGVPDVSVESLKANCQLSGFVRDDPVLAAFWAVLHEMSPKERCLFVKFTCGLSRLPTGYNSAQKLKIVAENDSDSSLPRASTCFWSFYLPRYSKKEIMRERIITAITNCGDIDNDFLVQN
jgi:E3 ubiquitin-protein ligase HERC1